MDLAEWDLWLCIPAGAPTIIVPTGNSRSGSDAGAAMETFTLGLGNWLRCVTGRNSLARVSDRLEAAALLLAVAVVLIAAAIAGAVGTAYHDSLAREYATDRASRHTIVATAMKDSVLAPESNEKSFLTTIRWDFLGREHEDEVRSDRMKMGDITTIWIDASGNRTTEPLTDGDAAIEAVLAAFTLWFTAMVVAATAWTLLRISLDRSRYAAWDRELDDLADNGGRTSHNP
jgi:hypothetical protein